MGGTWGAGTGTGTGLQELLGEQGGLERLWTKTAGVEGPATREDENINETIYVSWVCVRVQEFIRGNVRATDRRWYVRSFSERTTSGTVGTGDWNPPCAECPRPTWTCEYSRILSSQNVFIHVSLVDIG